MYNSIWYAHKTPEFFDLHTHSLLDIVCRHKRWLFSFICLIHIRKKRFQPFFNKIIGPSIHALVSSDVTHDVCALSTSYFQCGSSNREREREWRKQKSSARKSSRCRCVMRSICKYSNHCMTMAKDVLNQRYSAINGNEPLRSQHHIGTKRHWNAHISH